MSHRIWICAVLVWGSACTTALYNGPQRASSEVAFIESDESMVGQIDGVATPYSGGNFARYEILPGNHSIGVWLNKGGNPRLYSTGAYTLCIHARAGKTYRVQIESVGMMWRPHVFEYATEQQDASQRPALTEIADTKCQGDATTATVYGTICEQGEPQACYTLGELYKEGRGVPQDDARAASLFAKACAGGMAQGCNSFGVLCKKGQGVPQDESRAFKVFERACEGEVAQGCFNLGAQYMEGRVVTRDEARAATLFEKACQGGMATACSK